MPGPGPHLMYAMSSGIALTHLTKGRFTPHHTLIYALNAFFGPDMGSFSEWLSSTFFDDNSVVSSLADEIHHPFYYVVILGFPLCVFYSWLSNELVGTRILDYGYGVPLSRLQALFLIAAGSLSHFFLDHLFEEDGHTKMYTWIMSTGWWINRAPINPDAVIIVGFLCVCLVGGFIYINSQIYWMNPRRPPVGEEADLGVLVFMAIYFLLPHWLCILSMDPIPLRTQRFPV
ncbi:uncharacterized protein LOC120184146 [Hibiscus syriacus]|uniref:uncharacterized protein LOC120184146 n=1 Tax=Hibiscus syriacus TaxID=106335 RepID=UPI00192308B3|nr:uncharacterized protein LOC120184146 [Hibiscus syriacus]